MHVIKLLGQSAAVGLVVAMAAFVFWPRSVSTYHLALVWAGSAGGALLVMLGCWWRRATH